MDIHAYWAATLAQRPEEMRAFFCADAWIDWPNTNERFTVAEFVRANCEYPGRWTGRVERVEPIPGGLVAAVRVAARDGSASFHVVSFARLREEKIAALTEYWGDDGPPPAWRCALRLGQAIPETGAAE